MEKELWVKIKYGYTSKEISSFGRFRNRFTKQVMRTCLDYAGYERVSFRLDKKSRTFKVHKLVADHFLPIVEGKNQINHKDFNKQNNRVSNLERCTCKENIRHFIKNKFKHIITDEQVKYVRENIGIGATKLSKELNLTVGYIYGVANGIHRSDIHTELIRPKKPSLPVEVLKLDKNNNVIEKYTSLSEAARMNNTKLGHIQRVLTGERKSLNGFRYKSEGYPQRKRTDIHRIKKYF